MSCQDALHAVGIALLASSAACFAAAAWAYRALDIRGAKADLAGIRAGGIRLAEQGPTSLRASRAVPLRSGSPAPVTSLADELTTPLASSRIPRFRITRKDIVAASDQDMESDRA